MEWYGFFMILVGVSLGIPIGYTLKTVHTKWYLSKHMKEHPEYKMYMDLLQNGPPKKKQEKSSG